VARTDRFVFVDQLRGLIIALMGLDHASNYFNAVWKRVDYNEFLFDTAGQFIIRFLSYLCAPGFLMLAGAMVWLSFEKRLQKGGRAWDAGRGLALRGFFLILVQLTWVNASWGGFQRLRLDHFGIIACIGASLVLLTLIVRLGWWQRLLIALMIIVVHPLLLRIDYDPGTTTLSMRVMQLFIDSGSWNLYPVLPWFALAIFGSVAGEMWFRFWRDPQARLRNTFYAGLAFLALFFVVRIPEGYGNIFPFDRVGTVSFWFVQKYPPSLAHNFLFPAATCFLACLFMVAGRLRWLFHPLEVYGRTPFFFYVIHIPLLAIITRRLELFPWKEGEVTTALLAWLGLLVVMYPLCRGYGWVKARSTNPLIRMM